VNRDEAIRRIREGLRARSGKAWSVRGGRGTGWGWIRISAQPNRRKFDWDGRVLEEERFMRFPSADDRAELAKLLGLRDVHPQGERVPASADYYQEYVDRAEGREPTVRGKPYWD
jgi:hypothetical protein